MCTLIFELTCIIPNIKNKKEIQKERMEERGRKRENKYYNFYNGIGRQILIQ